MENSEQLNRRMNALSARSKTALLLFVIVFAGVMLIGSGLHAQQTPHFTQFTELKSYVNPAATAAGEVLRFGLAGRHQWMELRDVNGNSIGPQTYMAFADIPLTGLNGGLGFHAMFDRMAYEETIYLRINGAKHLKAGRNGSLSVGLSVDFISKSFDFGLIPSGSPSIPGGGLAGLGRASGIDLGAGVFYRHEQGTFVGVSANNLLESTLIFSGFNFGYERQFQLMAGTYIPLLERRNVSLALLPAFLVQSSMALVPQYTAQATLLINDRYFAGLAYRYEDAVGAIAGVVVGNLRIGLSYDYTTSLLRDAGSLGSPEIILSWGKSSMQKVRWAGRCYP